MDRNREGRRAASNLPAAPNGLSRRRHRSSSLRDSPEDDGPEITETARLRDRGIKKDRDRDRERDKERERERSRSSKRRRADRLMNAGDDSSEEDQSVNDEEDDDEDVDVAGTFSRMLPPLPNPILSGPPPLPSISSNHNNHSHHHQHRKSFPPATAAKVFKAATVPAWKATDEMIGVSVPRKARTASTKRSHDWISGGGGGGEQMIHRQASTSPVRQGGLVSSTPSPAAVRDAPLSPPSSSNASIKKKIKPSGGGAKPRPQPRSTTTSKSSSSNNNNNNNNPEELEIEIAEVLYGLMTQSQAPLKNDLSSKHEFNNKSSSETKSRASSPVSNSSSAAPLSAVAPKRKKPRQLTENNLVGSSSTRNSPSMKVENDQTPRSEICSPNLERNLGSAAENGESAILAKSLAEANKHPLKPMKLEASMLSESKAALMEEAGESRDAGSTTKEVVNYIKKDLPMVKLKDDPNEMTVTLMATSTNVITAVPASEKKREEKFQIDLMAPPTQLRSSPEREGAVGFVGDQNKMVSDMEKRGEMSRAKETDKVGKIISKEETVIQSDVKSAKTAIEEVEIPKSYISKERNIDLHFDLEKPGMDSTNNSQNDHIVKSQVMYSKAFKEEQSNTEKSAQSISLSLPMTVASWPGGISPPIGYMAPLQGVVSMEGGTMPSAPIQPLFSQPRPKRCATHCHIARNIHCYQQLMKMNPFWPAPSSTASMFGAKPSNINVMPPTELHGNISGRSLNSVQDKGHSLAIFPGNAGKEKFPQPTIIPDAGHGKQQILPQQAMPPVPPNNNILHGPAFIFPFNPQQAAVVAASGRPASAKSPATTGSIPSTGGPNSASVTASAPAPGPASALGFNYPNMPASETQYLVLQNSPYPFQIPAVGAPPNFRGHAQPMPMFNGSFYPSQMIHPLQLQQQQAAASQQQQIQQTHQNTSNSSTLSQKHLQSPQHRPQGIAINGGGTGSGVLHNFPAPKSRSSQHQQHITPPQARQPESEVGSEDSPSGGDSRGSRGPVNIYNQNFAMPIHPQNFALMGSPAASAGAATANSGNQNDKKQMQQHQGFKSGVESIPSQTFAMSYGPMIGSTSASGIDLSSMSQNHAILQSLPEATRQSYHQIMHAAATAQAAQQKKNSRMPEDGKNGSAVPSNADEERKISTGKAPASNGQSISFSRSDFADVSGSATPGNSVVDSSTRTLNLASGPNRMPNVMNSVGASNSHLHAQLQHQQQLIQMHNQQQHQQQQQLAANATARSKTPTTSNGITYSDNLNSSPAAAKFPNSISSFPSNFVQSSNNSSPAQSPQWKNSNKIPTSQVQSSLVSSTSSLKNHQQQQTRTLQNHTQISFGANQKPSASQGQQHPNSSQSPSPAVVVGSPTHSSISKGATSSPRTNTASTNKSGQGSTLSSQQVKNSTSVPSQKSSPAGGRNVPSVLGNPHNASSLSAATKTQIQLQQQQQQFQQQLSKQTLQQALFFSNSYLQGQPPNSASSNTSAASGYYLQRRRPEQVQQSQQPQGSSTSSSGMLSMCPPATQSSTSTTDPAKAAAAAAAASNMKGGGLSSQGIINSAQFGLQSSGNSHQLLPVGFPYGHSIPAAVQVKPAEQKQPTEQKQPAA